MGYAADFERASAHYVYASGTVFTGLVGDFTWETWWKPESLVSGEDQTLLYGSHSSGGATVRVWKTDSGGSNRLRLRLQEVGGLPLVDQHCEIEWDVDAIIAAAAWDHLAILVDISQPVATIAELVANGVSQGNGSVISGTDCSSIAAPDNGFYIGRDPLGSDALDGLLFCSRLWPATLRTVAQIAANYMFPFNDSSQSGLSMELWKGGQHHWNGSVNSASGDGDWATGPTTSPTFAADVPPNITSESGDIPARLINDGPSDTNGVLPTEFNHNALPARVFDDGPGDQSGVLPVEYNLNVAGGELITAESGLLISGVQFRMRAYDSTLGRIVYWNAPSTDAGGSYYSGPGPLSDVVVSEKTAD
jgi:hypothetical protein